VKKIRGIEKFIGMGLIVEHNIITKVGKK